MNRKMLVIVSLVFSIPTFGQTLSGYVLEEVPAAQEWCEEEVMEVIAVSTMPAATTHPCRAFDSPTLVNVNFAHGGVPFSREPDELRKLYPAYVPAWGNKHIRIVIEDDRE